MTPKPQRLFDDDKFREEYMKGMEYIKNFIESEMRRYAKEKVRESLKRIKYKIYDPDFRATLVGYLKVPTKEWNDMIDVELERIDKGD